MGRTISSLPPATEFGETDVFEIEQGGASKSITKQQLRALLFSDPLFGTPAVLPQLGDVMSFDGSDFTPGGVPRWRVIDNFAYVEAAVASSSTITFSGGTSPTNGIFTKATEYFSVGDPVRVVISGTPYYGICSAVTDTLLTIRGAILPTSTAIQSLSVGTRDMVKHVEMRFAGATYNGSSTLVLTNGCLHRWSGATGYLCGFACSHMNTSSTTVVQLQMNGGSNVTASGVIPAAGTSTTHGAFVANANGTLIAANVAIADGQIITAKTTTVGTSADYLVICMTFVVP